MNSTDHPDSLVTKIPAVITAMQATADAPPPRRPLQSLPILPLNKRPQPIVPNGSPLVSMATLKSVEPMTPPATPVRPSYKRSSLSAGSSTLGSLEEETFSRGNGVSVTEAGTVSRQPSWEATKPRPYRRIYKFDDTRYAEYGRGVWSVVHRAHEVPVPSSSLPTPPSSPDTRRSARPSAVVAVKSPSRRDAQGILYHEARILTYLHSFSSASDYLVLFHGYDFPNHSIVLDPLPLNLDAHVKTAASTARTNFFTRTMFDPVIGVDEWSRLATQLISGLSFIHAHACVHGDIKPANILLRNTPSGSFSPLYCDFSSSLHTGDSNPTEITALTPDYSAPELLASLTTSKKPTWPTLAADVYALAVTLLFTATGESPYAGARMEILKLTMAKEGRPLDFARSGDQGARIRKGSLVERCLIGALRKGEARLGVESWLDEVKIVIKEVVPAQAS